MTEAVRPESEIDRRERLFFEGGGVFAYEGECNACHKPITVHFSAWKEELRQDCPSCGHVMWFVLRDTLRVFDPLSFGAEWVEKHPTFLFDDMRFWSLAFVDIDL